MENQEQSKLSIDILKHLENISSKVNQVMSSHTKTVFERYPITFALLILFGVIAVHEGVKGILKEVGLLELNPWYLLVAGIGILTITGTLYKKLDK